MPRHCKQFHKMYFSIIVLQLQDTVRTPVLQSKQSLVSSKKWEKWRWNGEQVDISVILAG